MTSPVKVDVLLDPGDLATTLRHDVAVGLTADPRWLPPRWFYDDRGSELFDQITRLPEYYPTRRERSILEAEAGAIASVSGAEVLVELGSGTSEKTRLLLDALTKEGQLECFVPFDVSEATLRTAAAGIAEAYPALPVHAVVGDFERHLGAIPHTGRRLVAFLGGTIGNLVPSQRSRFLTDLAANLQAGEWLLVGTDLVKDPRRLVAAYDDSSGVTAAFNRNVLGVVNRELGADFQPEKFTHSAVWDSQQEWVEMRLRSDADQRVRIEALDLDLNFGRGEELRTEISAKFRKDGVSSELAAAGFSLERWWTDDAGDFGVALAVRR